MLGFHNKKRFDEVFDAFSLTQAGAPLGLPYVHHPYLDMHAHPYFSPMCWVSGLTVPHSALYVHPRPEVLAWLRDQVIFDWGGMMWTIYVRESDALVRCVYQSICGRRDVAIIDPTTIPQRT